MSDSMAAGDVPATDAAPEPSEAPVIDRTSDAWDGTGQDAEPEAEQTTEAEAEATDEPAEATEEGETDEDGEPISPAKAKSLRSENHSMRERMKAAESLFEGIHEDDATFLKEAIGLLKEDPAAFIERLAPFVDAVRGQNGEPATSEDEPDDDVPMTKAQFEKEMAARERKVEQARAEKERTEAGRKAVQDELKSLGYEPTAQKGTPEARRSVAVQALALNEFDGDLKAAHEWLEEERRGAVRAVAKTKNDQRAGAPPVTNGQAGAKTEKMPPMYLPGSTRVNPAWEKAFDGG